MNMVKRKKKDNCQNTHNNNNNNNGNYKVDTPSPPLKKQILHLLTE